MENKKYKYMLFLYKESEHWVNDYDSSQYYTTFTDKVEELIRDLHCYVWFNGKFRPEWEITTIVKGVVVNKNSFVELLREEDRKVEERRLQYELKMQEQRRIETERLVKEQEEYDKREWQRLKMKFGDK